ncbi:MAG: 3'-5' exonuclease [Burkholderiales bacterium]
MAAASRPWGGWRRWWAAPWRRWLLYHLADAHFSFMYDAPPADEWVALDCETTGLDVSRDEIISIGAVRIVGNRLLTSQRLELIVRPERSMAQASMRVHRLRESDVAAGMPPEQAMRRLLEFIGSRPLVGYYLEFDVGMINRAIWPMLGVGLPQPKIDISALYYDMKNRQLPAHLRNERIDLRFETIMRELELPSRDAHDALNDAVMAGLAFLKLRRC